MLSKRSVKIASLFIILAFVAAACATPAANPTSAPATSAPAATTAATVAPTAAEGSFQIPEIESGKFNVAMVLIGPHDDGGWSQSHYEGLQYIEKNVPNTHTAYVELVPEGAEAEQVIRSLARKGFDLIFTTSFGFMEATGT
ncbi:MAG: BMP family ABC transporter substrate-binding protein, partial [Anaerolineales bacterium]